MPDLINMVGEPKAPPHSNTSFLAKMGTEGHHGVENTGKARARMVKTFTEAKENKSLTAEQKYKKMANAGLQYFKDQICAYRYVSVR